MGAHTDDRNSLYVYIYGFYLNFMDSGISPENLPLYKGKSAEGGKGYCARADDFCFCS